MFSLNGNRGILQARAALPWCDGRHASAGETLTARVLRGLGYHFTPQFEITRREHPGRSFFADFRIDGTPVLVEFDGRVKYDPSESEKAAVANFDEKNREDEIRRLGHWVVRLTHADLRRPPVVHSRIEETIRTARMLAA